MRNICLNKRGTGEKCFKNRKRYRCLVEQQSAVVLAGRWCCSYRRFVCSRLCFAMRPLMCVSAHGRAAQRASALFHGFSHFDTGKWTYYS